MGKKKTLKQKKLADVRKQSPQQKVAQESSSTSPTGAYSYSFTSSASFRTPVEKTQTFFVAHDLQKTALVSLIIIAFQIILFYLLKNHLIALPFVRY